MSDPQLQKALAALPKNTSKDQKQLLEELGARINGPDWDHFDTDLLLEMSATHYDLAKKRESGQPKLKIYTPQKDSLGPLKTIVDIVSDDMAFLVDSVVAEINKHNYLIDLLLHPILHACYDDNGHLQTVSDKDSEICIRQSHIHIHIRDTLSEDDRKALEAGLFEVLNDVHTCNQDWKQMLDKLKQARRDLENARTRRPLKEIQQYCAFLDYLYDNNFTLLGYREYQFIETKSEISSKTVKGSSLGLLSDDIKPAYINENNEGLPRNLQELRRNLPPLFISKTNRLATVHRHVPMDAIAIKIYDDAGNIIGEKLFLGLFTSVTYSRSVSDVPYLREKVEDVLELSGFIPGSHDRKALRHILEKYPRDELFLITPKDLLQISLSILRLQERQRIALFMRHDSFGRYISCLVYVPRDRFGTALRKTICAILEEELQGTCQNFYTSLDDSLFARIMFIIKIPQSKAVKYNAEQIEQRLQAAGETWQELLSTALFDSAEDGQSITALSHKYAEAFPIAYRSRYQAKHAVFDIDKIESVSADHTLKLDLYRPDDLELKHLRLKVYNPAKPLTLSDIMPILENLGLRAIAELPFEIKPDGADKPVWIHDFLLETPQIAEHVDIPKVKKNFESAFIRICARDMENDSLNKLILSANLNWHEITILRSYVRYLKQIRYPFGRLYIERALNNNPKIARLIVDHFKAFHNPANGDNAQSLAAGCAIAIDHALEAVDSLDEDRILRVMTALVEATLRTNYFQRTENDKAKPYLSMKFDSKTIPDLPEPRPYREIFVYSPRVEAVHLRGGPIARGGLRWSDRHEDFRTEVLGLMKAQMVKNSVIIP
ncbi:MAG: NAD-glutamate dehydrogenase domain-containing protein, partial [Bdellovibrionales bacterium]